MMKPTQAIKILIEDMECKKPYQSNYGFTCPECGEQIEQDDDFFYIGSKKVCNGCRYDLIEYLEDL